MDTILVSWFVGIVAFGFFALAASRANAGTKPRSITTSSRVVSATCGMQGR